MNFVEMMTFWIAKSVADLIFWAIVIGIFLYAMKPEKRD